MVGALHIGRECPGAGMTSSMNPIALSRH
jgi:hypothetical protein